MNNTEENVVLATSIESPVLDSILENIIEIKSIFVNVHNLFFLISIGLVAVLICYLLYCVVRNFMEY